MKLLKKMMRILPDKLFLQVMYYYHFRKLADLRNPKTFNEKLQWLKLYNRDPSHTRMVDKYLAKAYVTEQIGSEHVIPMYGVWKCAEDIDFDALPNQFVLKCNNDAGGIIICKDKSKLDRKEAISFLNKKIRNNGYWYGREWPYKNVQPRIIAEQYMEDFDGKGDLTDYKLHFFSGECKAIMVGANRYSETGLDNDYYTPEWEHFDFTRGHSHNAPTRCERPEKLDEMIQLGKVLAKDYPFVRIDFYVINQKIYFGEITFFPASGFNPFHPDEWDEIFGSWIQLPINKR